MDQTVSVFMNLLFHYAICVCLCVLCVMRFFLFLLSECKAMSGTNEYADERKADYDFLTSGLEGDGDTESFYRCGSRIGGSQIGTAKHLPTQKTTLTPPLLSLGYVVGPRASEFMMLKISEADQWVTGAFSRLARGKVLVAIGSYCFHPNKDASMTVRDNTYIKNVAGWLKSTNQTAINPCKICFFSGPNYGSGMWEFATFKVDK